MVLMNMRRALNNLSKADIYGHPIGVNYQGQETYSTNLGCLCTLATLVLILINTGTSIMAFFSKTNQDVFYQQVKSNTEALEPFNLIDSGIKIVIKARDAHVIPPQIGNWKAYVHTTTDGEESKQRKKLVECTDEVISMYEDKETRKLYYNYFQCLDEDKSVLQG